MDSKIDETNFTTTLDDVERVGFTMSDETDIDESDKALTFDDHILKMVGNLLGKDNFKIIKK